MKYPASRRITSAALTAALVSLFSASTARAVDTAEKPATSELEPGYLRVTETDDGMMSLDIAVTTFASNEENRPTITLVGVAHVGDAAYYTALQEILGEHDLVLYESVMPDGVNAAELDDDADKRAYTRDAMSFVWSQVMAFEMARGRHPASLEELREFAVKSDSRVGPWIADARDGWGRPLVYRCDDLSDSCELLSYGADGKAGGDGHAADLTSRDAEVANVAAVYAEASDDRLQAQLADALGLEFQLDAIDYADAGWVCSDMSMNELSESFAARGLDFAPIGSTLAGSSLSGTVLQVLLRLVQLADVMLDGAIADMFKVVMIELLGDEKIMEQSLQQFGAEFADVIIGERNRVVMDDLEQAVASGRHETIAVFYGAGHLPDFEQRFAEQLGYEPVCKTWLAAISVNTAESSVPQQQLRQMRIMIRRSIAQNLAMQQRQREAAERQH